ncbi:hypothetical protein GCM10010452_39420 [Crossiella cryophila]
MPNIRDTSAPAKVTVAVAGPRGRTTEEFDAVWFVTTRTRAPEWAALELVEPATRGATADAGHPTDQLR